MSKSVQIPEETFVELVKYFCLEDHAADRYHELQRVIQEKFDKLVNHMVYTQYKTAATEQEREKARQEYLDRVGMRESFRWQNTDYNNNFQGERSEQVDRAGVGSSQSGAAGKS